MSDQERNTLCEQSPEQIDCGRVDPSWFVVGKPGENMAGPHGHGQNGASQAEMRHIRSEVTSNGGLTGGRNIADRPVASLEVVKKARADVRKEISSKRK